MIVSLWCHYMCIWIHFSKQLPHSCRSSMEGLVFSGIRQALLWTNGFQFLNWLLSLWKINENGQASKGDLNPLTPNENLLSESPWTCASNFCSASLRRESKNESTPSCSLPAQSCPLLALFCPLPAPPNSWDGLPAWSASRQCATQCDAGSAFWHFFSNG